jgi:hypothetical protein
MRRRTIAIGAVLSIALGLVACSGGDEDGSDSTSTTNRATTSTTADSTTSSSATQPAGTDTEAVTPVLQALIGRYDAAVAAILADPRVAADRDSEAVVAYLELFTADSSFANGALRSWATEGENGRFYRPGPRGQLTQSTVTGLTDASADEATFTICAQNSIEITDEAGTVLESQGGQTAASVVAIRVDGSWVLRDLTEAPVAACPQPGDDQ